MTVLIKYNCSSTSWYPIRLYLSISLKKGLKLWQIHAKVPSISQPRENMNSLSVLNIKVIKPKRGQKLHCGLLHQVIFTYSWYNHFLVVMSSWIIRNYPYPQNSEILEMLRNVKSACNSLVHGNVMFYFYYLCIMFQFCNVIAVQSLI